MGIVVKGCRKAALRFLAGIDSDASADATAAMKAVVGILESSASEIEQYQFWQNGDPNGKLPEIRRLVAALIGIDKSIAGATH